jgi:hypothetical protein
MATSTSIAKKARSKAEAEGIRSMTALCPDAGNTAGQQHQQDERSISPPPPSAE